MAIANEICDRASGCVKQASVILSDARQGRVCDPTTVFARRGAADIAATSLYGILNKAFVTPIDREDLWLIHTAGEAVIQTTEDLVLCFYHAGRPVPSSLCEAMNAVEQCLSLSAKADDEQGADKRWQGLRHAERVLHRTLRDTFADATARRCAYRALRVVDACRRWLNAHRYSNLKNG